MLLKKYGKLIKEKREALNIKQADLATGICTADYLSKVELGKRCPTFSVYEALTERLGFVNEMQIVLMGTKEHKIEKLKFYIDNNLSNNNHQDIEEKLNQLQLLIKENDNISMQYIKSIQGVLKLHKNEYNDGLGLLKEAMRKTYKDFDFSCDIRRCRFTYREVVILFNIANTIFVLEDKIEAIKMYYDIKEYIEKLPKDSEVYRRTYSMILYNLSTYLGRCKLIGESYEICELGLKENDASRRYIISNLPKFLLNLACCYEEQGDMDKFKGLIKQAYFIYKALDNEDYFIVEKYAKERGVDLSVTVSVSSTNK